MRNFGQFCRKCLAVSVLMLALAGSTFAGEIPYPGVTAPPPATTDGEIPYPGITSSTEGIDGEGQYPGATIDSVKEFALNLWQSALTLF